MMTKAEIASKIAAVRWYHRFDFDGVTTAGVNDSAGALKHLELPADLSGLRVLDVGARDGFFSFECERRGAEVIAIDYVPSHQTGFDLAKQILGSELTLHHKNIYSLSPDDFGQFDIVLFLGVIYHLPDPMLALGILRKVCRGVLLVESHIMDGARPEMAALPVMEFYPRDSLNGDFTNYWGPTMLCLEKMIEECNFDITWSKRLGDRGVARATVRSEECLQRFADIARGRVEG